ncbi:hypothetical protein [Sideroxydans sp.]
MLLMVVHPLRRCPSLYYLSFVFSLHYTIRYFFLQGLEHDYLYDVTGETKSYLGMFLLISSVFYSLLAISVHYSSGRYRTDSLAKSELRGLRGYANLGRLSIILFAAPVMSGVYSIGREIESVVGRLVVRASLFLQYFQVFIFFSPSVLVILFYLALLSASLIIFGSKAFIYTLALLYLYYAVIANVRFNYLVMAIFSVLLVISIMMFDVMLAYRSTNEINLDLAFNFSGRESFFDSLNALANRVGGRFGGLDTSLVYGLREASYSIQDMGYELVTAINNFIFGIKIPIPADFIPSEMRTAYIFRDYDFSAHLEGLRHTDSMFGLSRFISVEYGFGLLLFLLCLLLPFIAFKGGNYYLDIAFKMFFFNEVLIGGAFSTLFRLAIEIGIIYMILKLPFVRRILGARAMQPKATAS